MAAEAKNAVPLEVNEEHHVQIKNTYYSYTYLKCILYYFNKLNLKIFFSFLLLKNGVAWGIRENTAINH
jgi:hypothetical protein